MSPHIKVNAMSEKKTVAMTPKKFFRAKLSGKTTAEAFLAAHRAFLNNHSFLSPILEAYDNAELLPTPTFEACKAALFTHVIESEIKTAKDKIAKSVAAASGTKIIRKGDKDKKDAGEPKKASGNYTITIMVKLTDREGNVTGEDIGSVTKLTTEEVEKDGVFTTVQTREEEPAVYSANDYSSAERKADRSLFAMADSLYALIENNEGAKVITTIMRADGIARLGRSKKGAVSRERGKSTKSLGFGVKASNDRTTGPWNF